jgi:hypothetical protein
MTKLDPDVKAKWVAALRSGNYEQGYHLLKYDNRYCCLGVFCEIMRVPVSDTIEGAVLFDNEKSVLPLSVQHEYGFSESEVYINLTQENVQRLNEYIDVATNAFELDYTLLTTVNDRGVPFDVIADLIEEHL